MDVAAERLAPVQVATLDDTKAFEGLTTAQHRFVTLMLSGLTSVEAYRAVYDTTGWGENSVYHRAHDAAQHPLVIAKLREMRARIEAQSTLAPNITREFVLNGIKEIALNSAKDSTRLQALVHLGKSVGIDLFREVHVTEKVTRTAEDAERDLRDKLLELKAQLTIDGDAKPVADPKPADRRRKPKRGA